MIETEVVESKSNVIMKRDGFSFEKLDNKCYYTTFDIKNNNLNLTDIVNFDLIKVLYDLNPDIYDLVEIEKINNSEANLIIVMKHLFKDLGLPQKYSYLNIKFIKTHRFFKFESKPIKRSKPPHVPISAEVVDFERIETIGEFITNNYVVIKNYTYFGNVTNTMSYFDKIAASITFKIINRVINFISNYNNKFTT
jgi:hypothetical protein